MIFYIIKKIKKIQLTDLFGSLFLKIYGSLFLKVYSTRIN